MDSLKVHGQQRRNRMHAIIAAVAVLALGGSALRFLMVYSSHSPYEQYLPKDLPSEANRWRHEAGYSLVSPAGWAARVLFDEKKSQYRGNSPFASEETIIEAPKTAEGKSFARITVVRYGTKGNKHWDQMLQAAQSNPNWRGDGGLVLGEFQNQPALVRFDPGPGGEFLQFYDGDRTWLSHQVVFRRSGQWFSMAFYMKNADRFSPYYTKPLPIIQHYFDTFRFEPPDKKPKVANP